MAVLDPVKLVIDNYAENETEELTTENLPNDPFQCPNHSFFQGALDRKGGFYGSACKKMVPPGARDDGKIEERLHYSVRQLYQR